MANNNRPELPAFRIENTKFVYNTNFAGDPTKNMSGRATRCCNIMLNDREMLQEFINNGIHVKAKPADERYNDIVLDDDGNSYHIKALLSFNGFEKPIVKLVTNDNGVQVITDLNESTIQALDKIRANKVHAMVQPGWDERHNCWVLWIRTLYVEARSRNTDPFADRYDTPNEDTPW